MSLSEGVKFWNSRRIWCLTKPFFSHVVYVIPTVEFVDLLTSRAFERDRTSAEREARASERKLVPGPTTLDQKTMRTTLRKSIEFGNKLFNFMVRLNDHG